MDPHSHNVTVLEASALDVSSAWGHRIRLTGINWKVLPGEYWVIGGPHGSGKTDLLMTAAGLRRPAAGSVRIFGCDFSNAPETELMRQRARVGFVFKGGGRMFNELTVAENVALALCYHHNWSAEQARADVEAALEATELTAMAGETAQTLGADWQQRVGLARALALKPEVMFLDEPAAGLEARHRQWWRDFLARLSGQKVTLIATTNDFTPWHKGNHRYALVQNNRWRVLEQRETPQFDLEKSNTN